MVRFLGGPLGGATRAWERFTRTIDVPTIDRRGAFVQDTLTLPSIPRMVYRRATYQYEYMDADGFRVFRWVDPTFDLEDRIEKLRTQVKELQDEVKRLTKPDRSGPGVIKPLTYYAWIANVTTEGTFRDAVSCDFLG